MSITGINENGIQLAVVSGEEKIITDVQSAPDLVMTARYETGADRIVIDKHAITEEFFILSTGLAGEVLQKFINYHVKAAIWGDYSRYTSKPLKDFIYESNKGKDFFFTETKEEAIRCLAEAET